MESQVHFLESIVDLKLALIWFLFSHDGLLTGCKFFILKVMPICIYTLFETAVLFVKSLHICPYCFSIAKELATCRFGGVISAQKVLF